MNPDLLVIAIYGMAAIAAILVAEAVYLILRARVGEKRAINRRLALRTTARAEDALIALRKERGLDAEGDYKFAIIALNRLFLQSGTRGDPLRFFTMFVFAGFAVFGVLTLLLGMPIGGTVAGLVVSFALPLVVLWRRRAMRQAVFAAQLPDAIDIIVRSLRAGHPTATSLMLVAREMPDPIGTEFGLVSDELSFGLDLDEALLNLSERIGLEDVRLVVTTVAIQNATGGNLAEILGNLAEVVRGRFRMRRKVKAISAQARWSAILLSIMPFALFAILYAVAPSYYSDIWDDPVVVPVMILACLWMFIGDIVMFRMVNFKS
ncbi:MAG: type II secretion system F family protein [Pseudomonadota bacterium]